MRQLFDVNFFGMVNLTQQVIPYMRQAKKGLIVNVSTVAGKVYEPFRASYVAWKHAVEGWSDCLRAELALFNIQVSILEPGFIQTEIFGLFEDLTPLDSPYKPLVEAHNRGNGKNVAGASNPSVVTNALVHAAESGKAKRRYVMGHTPSVILFIRTWLGDSVLEFLIKSNLSKALKNKMNRMDCPTC